MKKIEIHPASLLAGAALAVLAFASMAPSPVQQPSSPAPLGMVPARNMVQIKQGTPYVVPQGLLLVVTGVGSTASFNTPATLNVNGVQEIVTYPGLQSNWAYQQGDNLPEVRSMVPVPTGFAVPSGATVTVTGSAWGYVERY